MYELGLTAEQQSAIMKYKSGESYTLNCLLRDGMALADYQQNIKDGLNEALKNFPVYDGVVYRNIGFITKENFDAFVAEHKDKTSITYSAFTSASKAADGYVVEAPYLVHYEIDSVNGRDVSQIGIKSEKEILFATDTMFEIVIVKQAEREIFLKLKVINSNGEGKSDAVLKERREQHSVQESRSESDSRRSDEEVHSTSNAVRGRSTTDDELYRNSSESNSRRIDESSGTDNTIRIGKTGDASDREGTLSGINADNVVNRTDDGRRASLAMDDTRDAEYLELAENPEQNEDRLRELVDEAAEEAGYNSPKLYHGTNSFGFTEFDLSKMDDKRTIFLTSNEKIASTYSGVSGERKLMKMSEKFERVY